jgi:hypothetical protein
MRLAAIRPVNLVAVHVAHGHLDRRGYVGDDKFYRHEDYAYTSAAALGVRINTTPMDLASAGFVLCHVGYARSILYGIQAKAQGAMQSNVGGAPGPGLTFAALADDDGRIPSPRHWYHDERDGNAERAARNSQRYCDAVLRLLEWDGADSVVIPPSQKRLQSIDDGIAWIKANMGRLAPAQE